MIVNTEERVTEKLDTKKTGELHKKKLCIIFLNIFFSYQTLHTK